MKIRAIMTTDIGFCNLEDSLTQAAEIMWQKDCGVVPVIDGEKKIVGMITDRDICIAAATRDQKPSDIKAMEIISDNIISCKSNEKVEKALKKMKKYQLKRLAIVGKKCELVGILSINDILLGGRKVKKLRKKIYQTLKAIGTPRPIILKEIEPNAEVG